MFSCCKIGLRRLYANFSLDLLGQHVLRPQKSNKCILSSNTFCQAFMQIVLKKKLDYDTPRILSLNNINPLSNGLILGKMITVHSFLWWIQLPFGVPPTPFSILPSLASVHYSLMITGYPRREEDDIRYLWHQSAHQSFCFPSPGHFHMERGCLG